MGRFFLRSKECDPTWSRGRQVAYWLWNGLWVLLAGAGIGLVSMLLASGTYPVSILKGYLDRPRFFCLNLAPVLVLTLLAYALTRSARRGYLLTAALVLGFSAVNYYKIAFRDDPLMFADLFLVREAGNMAGKYQLFLDKRLSLALAAALAGYLFLALFVRGRPGKGKVRWGLVGLSLVLGGTLAPTILSDSWYNTHGAYYAHLTNQYSATQQYISRGFVYPFLHSISTAMETPPEGYEEKAVATLLDSYLAQDIPEDKKVNVMGIMLESYNDFTKFGTPELNQDVYAVWHQLEEEGWSGDLVDNIFAGGTVDTERGFLTGYSDLRDIRGNTNSIPWYFRSQGYKVEGMHPCYEWFYNRVNINERLGFEKYDFVENYFNDLTGGQVAMDDIFFPELLKTYQEATQGDEPYFSFSVTYQGHGPYDSDICWWGKKGEFVKEQEGRSEEEQYILDNYFGSIANTNKHLKELTDYLRTDEEPVVLVLFGDHNPWMGDGNSVYQALGIDLDLSTEGGFYNYYATRYIIWANDAAKEMLGKDIQGEGPAISPCFLMSEVFEQCGWTGPSFLQLTGEVKKTIQAINTPTGLYVEKGSLTAELSREGEQILADYNNAKYYERRNFRYGEAVR